MSLREPLEDGLESEDGLEFEDGPEFEGEGEERYWGVGCPEHGRSAIRPLQGSWECDEDAVLHHGHVVYRCARCDRSFDHDISGPDVQWIIHQGR